MRFRLLLIIRWIWSTIDCSTFPGDYCHGCYLHQKYSLTQWYAVYDSASLSNQTLNFVQCVFYLHFNMYSSRIYTCFLNLIFHSLVGDYPTKFLRRAVIMRNISMSFRHLSLLVLPSDWPNDNLASRRVAFMQDSLIVMHNDTYLLHLDRRNQISDLSMYIQWYQHNLNTPF